MHYLAVAFDYDGTIATKGCVDDDTLKALKDLKASGRKLIMVTGRELDDLIRVFPELALFDKVVCENGALYYDPVSQEEEVLTEPASQDLVKELEKRNVTPVSCGRCIVATWEPHEKASIEAIRDLGLELQVIFNKGAVMILPSGINKGFGLKAALKKIGLSPHNVIGVGDAENDHAFLSLCEVSVAVANALPAIKDRVDIVTKGDHGKGITEMIAELLDDEFASRNLTRHDVVLGTRCDGSEMKYRSLGTKIMIAGPSGGGKSNATLGIIDSLSKSGYQFCLIDPEGDYESFDTAVVLGDTKNTASADEVIQLLRNPTSNPIVNLLGQPLQDRPAFFSSLLPRLQELRAECGRPHWIVIDEAHHLLPKDWQPAPNLVPQKIDGLLMITVHPDMVSPEILEDLDYLIAISDDADQTISEFAKVVNKDVPPFEVKALEKGQGLVWQPKSGKPPEVVDLVLSNIERRRHRRKYAEGELPEDMSFYFTGPHDLNLRAQNLMIFKQMAEGLDEPTWTYHLERGEYSKWFEKVIKDKHLAEIAKAAETNKSLAPDESRKQILDAIEERYTSPVEV